MARPVSRWSSSVSARLPRRAPSEAPRVRAGVLRVHAPEMLRAGIPRDHASEMLRAGVIGWTTPAAIASAGRAKPSATQLLSRVWSRSSRRGRDSHRFQGQEDCTPWWRDESRISATAWAGSRPPADTSGKFSGGPPAESATHRLARGGLLAKSPPPGDARVSHAISRRAGADAPAVRARGPFGRPAEPPWRGCLYPLHGSISFMCVSGAARSSGRAIPTTLGVSWTPLGRGAERRLLGESCGLTRREGDG